MKKKAPFKKYNKLENNEVDTRNCCQAIITNKFSSKSSLPEQACRKLSSDRHERGIKLVKNHIFKANHQNKRHALTHRESQTDKDANQNTQKEHFFDRDWMKQVPEKNRVSIAKKCVDYKNKKIYEHSFNLQPNISESQLIRTKIIQNSNSTLKNTPRTLKTSIVNKSYSTFQNIEASHLINTNHSYNLEASQKQNGKSFELIKSKPTLQKIHEKNMGKKIITIESLLSESSSEIWSVVETHNWNFDI